jgi:hypothetical protein
MSQAATFLLQFQTHHPRSAGRDSLCATATITATIEDADQDPGSLVPALAATQTITNTVEDADQDPADVGQILAATATMTKTREDPDQDPQQIAGIGTMKSPDENATVRSYFAILRSTCSSS